MDYFVVSQGFRLASFLDDYLYRLVGLKIRRADQHDDIALFES
jgi:hypothetical protein